MMKTYQGLLIATLFYVCLPINTSNAAVNCADLNKDYEASKSLGSENLYALGECFLNNNFQVEILGENDSADRAISLFKKAAEKNHFPSLLILGQIYENGYWGGEADYQLALEFYQKALAAAKRERSQQLIELAEIEMASHGIQILQWDTERKASSIEMLKWSFSIYEKYKDKFMNITGKEVVIHSSVSFSVLCSRINLDKDLSFQLSKMGLLSSEESVRRANGKACFMNLFDFAHGIATFSSLLKDEEWVAYIPENIGQQLVDGAQNFLEESKIIKTLAAADDAYSTQEITENLIGIVSSSYLNGYFGPVDAKKALQILNGIPSVFESPVAISILGLITLELLENSPQDYEAELFEELIEELSKVRANGNKLAKLYAASALAELLQHERRYAMSMFFMDDPTSEKRNQEFFKTLAETGDILLMPDDDSVDENPEAYQNLVYATVEALVLAEISTRNPSEEIDTEGLKGLLDYFDNVNPISRLITDIAEWKDETVFFPEDWFEREVIEGRFDVLPLWDNYNRNFTGISPYSAKLMRGVIAELCSQYCSSPEQRKEAAVVVASNQRAPLRQRRNISFEVEKLTSLIGNPEGKEYIRKNHPGFILLEEETKGRRVALIISNSEYKNFQNLASPINDAKAFKDILETKFGFDVQVITDASRKQMMKSIKAVSTSLNSDDEFILFYAGHGETIGETNYWLPVEANQADDFDWVDEDFIKRILKMSKSRNILIIADSCFSGTITRGIEIVEQNLDAAALEKFRNEITRVAITSGGNEKVLDGGAGSHSVFSGAVLDYLRKKDTPFTAAEIFSSIRTDVLKRSIALGGNQTPQYGPLLKAGHKGPDFVFEPITEKK